MTTLPRRLILAFLIGMVPFTMAAGQDTPVVPVPFDGTEAFGHILHSFDLKPGNEDIATLVADKTLLVVFGDLLKMEALGVDKRYLERFREQGGAILLASDYPDHGRLPFQLSCDGELVHAFPPAAYKGEELCPVVKRFHERAHPLFKDLKMDLAANRPSLLLSKGSQLKRLAGFPDEGVFRAGFGGDMPIGSGYIFGSPQDAAPAGRTVVVAGQGVFLNGMLMQTDNDNLAFAWNTIGWLAAGPHGRREIALFIDEGKVVSRFALPLSKFGVVPIPPIQVINTMIRGLEDENFFNEKLLERIGKGPILQVLVLLGSLAVLLFGALRFLRGRHRLDTGAALIIGKQEAAPPPGPVFWQRQEELRRQGNLWEPAQVLARQFFLDHAGVTVPLWDEAQGNPPPLEARGRFWQRRALQGQVRKLWAQARSSPAQPVSPRQFDSLLRLLSEATAAVTERRVRFLESAFHVHERSRP